MLNGQMHGNGRYQYADGSHYDGQWPVTLLLEIKFASRPGPTLLRSTFDGVESMPSTAQPNSLVDSTRAAQQDARAGPSPSRTATNTSASSSRTRRRAGLLQYIDGERYDGEWYGDKQHGQGTLTYASGDSAWVSGRTAIKMERARSSTRTATAMKGCGARTRARPRHFAIHDGRRTEGDWKDSLRHGPGRSCAADGKVYAASSPTV